MFVTVKHPPTNNNNNQCLQLFKTTMNNNKLLQAIYANNQLYERLNLTTWNNIYI
jgi:hypothetical protein